VWILGYISDVTVSAVCKSRHSIVTANALFFLFSLLFPISHLFLVRASSPLKLQHKVENGLSSHRNLFWNSDPEPKFTNDLMTILRQCLDLRQLLNSQNIYDNLTTYLMTKSFDTFVNLGPGSQIRPWWIENGTRHAYLSEKWQRLTAVAATVCPPRHIEGATKDKQYQQQQHHHSSSSSSLADRTVYSADVQFIRVIKCRIWLLLLSRLSKIFTYFNIKFQNGSLGDAS